MCNSKKSYIMKNNSRLFDSQTWENSFNDWLEKEKESKKENKKEKSNNPYNDPDNSCFQYYKDLCYFLNRQEKDYMGAEYGFEPWGLPFGIRVYNKSGETKFFLKSDQMGFSVPKVFDKNDKKNIYNLYYEDEKDRTNNIVKWIYESRQIGGGFLWPLEKREDGSWNPNPPFNLSRGRYQQDRVDKTLELIRSFYISETKFTTMANMNEWLSRFGKTDEGWKKYVNYMKLNDFVDDQLKVKKLTEKDGLSELTSDEIESLMKSLCEMISNRSLRIKEVINPQNIAD